MSSLHYLLLKRSFVKVYLYKHSLNVFHFNMVMEDVCVIITHWCNALYFTSRKNIVSPTPPTPVYFISIQIVFVTCIYMFRRKNKYIIFHYFSINYVIFSINYLLNRRNSQIEAIKEKVTERHFLS